MDTDKTDKNLMLADCDPTEIQLLKDGIERHTESSFEVKHLLSNRFHGSLMLTLRRYLNYFQLPLNMFFKHPGSKVIVGWQQFHAINYALYCRLFSPRRDVKIFACNFTYKRKPGIIGKIYEKYMRFALHAPQMRGLHVPSDNYADEMASTLDLDRNIMMVTRFGTVDQSEKWNALKCPHKGFALAIGRSNRDFDFLAEIWSTPTIRDTGYKLIIISDTWIPKADISAIPNLMHLNNVKGTVSYSYIAHCDFSIVPIDQPNICSGDTVLLNSMMCSKAVVLTAPSTLSEMYVTDGVDGLYIPQDVESAAGIIKRIIDDPALRDALGKAARQKYVDQFSREKMADSMGAQIRSRI